MSNNTTINLIDIHKEQEVVTFVKAHEDLISKIKWNHFDRQILTCSYDSTLKLWDLRSNKCIEVYENNQAWQFTACDLSQDTHGRFICGGDNGGSLYLWDRRYGPQETLWCNENAHQSRIKSPLKNNFFFLFLFHRNNMIS